MVNYHSARVRDPEEFKKDAMQTGGTFATMDIAPGVSIIIGIPKGEKSTATQAYRFEADIFSPMLAKEWLKEQNVDYIDFEEAEKDNPVNVPTRKEGNLDSQSYSLLRGAEILKNRGLHAEAGAAEREAYKIRAELYRNHPGAFPEYASYVSNNPKPAMPKNPKPEARSPKPKRNPRPPLWQNKSFIATQGIGGVIYFGYQNPPGEFKTKKARRESGVKLYKAFGMFLKKFNLKADGPLSDQRKAAYEHGGMKKLKARAKRNSTLPLPNPSASIDRPKKSRNNNKSSPSTLSKEEAAARAYKYFCGGNMPTKALNVRKPQKRTVFINLCSGVDLTYETKYHGPKEEFSYDLKGKKINWDLENNALIIFVPELEKMLGVAFKKPDNSEISFSKRDERAGEKVYNRFRGQELKKPLQYHTMESKTMLVQFGKAKTIRYRSGKYGGSPNQLYKHDFDDDTISIDIANSAIVIMGRDLEITKHGIEG